jgi:hypothetical protein
VTFLKTGGKKVGIGSKIEIDIDSAIKNGELKSIKYTNGDVALMNAPHLEGHIEMQGITSDWVYRQFNIYDRNSVIKFKVLNVIPGPLDEKWRISAETSYLVIMPESLNGLPVKREVSGGEAGSIEHISDECTLMVIKADSSSIK